MKKMVIVLILIALMTPALTVAQGYYTLPEVRAQAAQRWNQTYTDQFGRVIPVNVEVQVYGADSVPVLRTSVAAYTLKHELLSEETQWREGKMGLGIYHNNSADAIFKSVRGEKAMIVHRNFGEKVDMDAVYGEEYGATITMREMTEHLSGVLAAHGIDATNYLFDEPGEFSVRCRMKRKTMEATEPAAYFAHFWPTMYGLPILAHVNETYAKSGWPTYYAQLVLTMRSEEEYTIHMTALEEMEKLAQDVPLCSFDVVKRCIETEIQTGHIRELFGVRLGYVISNDPENPKKMKTIFDANSYYLTPMWVVDCIYVDNAKKELAARVPADDELTIEESTSADRDLVMINAQTGEMLNRQDRSHDEHGNLNYSGFISWDDVK